MHHHSSVMEKKFQKCSRRIRTLQNERFDSKDWWEKLYKMMDEDVAIPRHRRFEVLREIFPEAILRKILSMMSLIGVEDGSFKRSKPKSISRSSRSETLDLNTAASVAPTGSLEDKIDLSFPNDNERKVLKGRNPYLGFFRRATNETAIWRPVPKPPLNDMKLTDKADAVTELIAQDFVHWLRKIENLESGQEDGLDVASVSKKFEDAFGLENPQPTCEMNQSGPGNVAVTKRCTKNPQKLTKSEIKPKDEKKGKKNVLVVSDIMKLFEIDVEHEASKSLTIAIKELPSVSRPIAESRKLSHKSCRETLHRLLQSDLNLTYTKAKSTAFNSTLPPELRWRPPSRKPIKPWYKPGYVNKDIRSMGTAWNGITDLWSTRGYCKWLVHNSKLEPPKCLKDAHMLDGDTATNELFEKETQVDTLHMIIGAAGEMKKAIARGGEIERTEDEQTSLESYQLHVL